MTNQEQKLTIEDLAELVDVPVRTIRFYISEGLIPGPAGRGKATTYGDEHLLRLRLARRLSEQRVPLAEIKEQMDGLTLADVESLLQEQAARNTELETAAQETSPKAYVAALLDRAQSLKGSPVCYSLSSAEAPEMLPRQAPPTQGGQAWRHWELAPGVELHVRQDAERRHRSLIDAMLRAARKQADAGDEQPGGK